MNFINNIPNQNFPNQFQDFNNMVKVPQDINQKIKELELKIKHLEQRIVLIENNNSNNIYTEPDNTLYMI